MASKIPRKIGRIILKALPKYSKFVFYQMKFCNVWNLARLFSLAGQQSRLLQFDAAFKNLNE